MGGAQPLAATMAGASMLAIECDPTRIEMRLKSGYLDKRAASLDEAHADPRRRDRARCPSGCSATPRSFYPRSCRKHKTRSSGRRWSPTRPRRTIPPTATCPSTGRCRNGKTCESASPTRSRCRRANRSPTTCRRSCGFKAMGIPCVDYGNNIRQEAKNAGLKNAFDYPGFVPAYIRPLFCVGKGPFRWVALSGDAGGHRAHRRQGARAVSRGSGPAALARSRREENHSSRACPRASAGSASASAMWRGSRSTRWCARASSRRRS